MCKKDLQGEGDEDDFGIHHVTLLPLTHVIFGPVPTLGHRFVSKIITIQWLHVTNIYARMLCSAAINNWGFQNKRIVTSFSTVGRMSDALPGLWCEALKMMRKKIQTQPVAARQENL